MLKILRITPGLTLLVLSPMIGELLSGSAPPSEFFTFFGFTIMTLLYGGGAILSRELKIRWGKGVGSLLIIGAAYGVIEEGLMVASFQNPNWMDLGILGSFGRFIGINWVWAVELIIYHSIVSITIPVLLVELIFPLEKNTSWLHGNWLKLISFLFVADVVVGFFLFRSFTGFTPPIPQYAFFIFLSFVLLYLAYLIPKDLIRRGRKEIRKPRHYFIVTFIGSILSGIIFGVLPQLLSFKAAPVFVILLGVGFIFYILRYIASFKWKNSYQLHYQRLIFGSLFVFMLLSYVQEFDPNRLDNTVGMSVVGTLFFASFMILGYKLRTVE